jgi:hypothetical protein
VDRRAVAIRFDPRADVARRGAFRFGAFAAALRRPALFFAPDLRREPARRLAGAREPAPARFAVEVRFDFFARDGRADVPAFRRDPFFAISLVDLDSAAGAPAPSSTGALCLRRLTFVRK